MYSSTYTSTNCRYTLIIYKLTILYKCTYYIQVPTYIVYIPITSKHLCTFTAQLQEIRKVKLSRILCDNADGLITIQPWALEMANDYT